MASELTQKEMARRGGEAFKQKYGSDKYREMQKKGVATQLERYGKEHFVELAKKGREAKLLKKQGK